MSFGIKKSSDQPAEWEDPVGVKTVVKEGVVVTTPSKKQATLSKMWRSVSGGTGQTSLTSATHPDFFDEPRINDFAGCSNNKRDLRESETSSELSKSVKSSSEPTPPPASRYRFFSTNPLKLLYEAAKSIGRLFQKKEFFVSSSMRVKEVNFNSSIELGTPLTSKASNQLKDLLQEQEKALQAKGKYRELEWMPDIMLWTPKGSEDGSLRELINQESSKIENSQVADLNNVPTISEEASVTDQEPLISSEEKGKVLRDISSLDKPLRLDPSFLEKATRSDEGLVSNSRVSNKALGAPRSPGAQDDDLSRYELPAVQNKEVGLDDSHHNLRKDNAYQKILKQNEKLEKSIEASDLGLRGLLESRKTPKKLKKEMVLPLQERAVMKPLEPVITTADPGELDPMVVLREITEV